MSSPTQMTAALTTEEPARLKSTLRGTDNDNKRSKRRVAAFRNLTLFILLASASVQPFISSETDNLVSLGLIVVSASSTIFLLFRSTVLAKFPLSTLQVLTFCGVTQLVPLFALALEVKPLTFSLHESVETFAWIAYTQMTLLAAHSIYQYSPILQSFRSIISRQVMVRLGIFKRPSALQIWILGTMGLASMIYVYWFRSRDALTDTTAATGLGDAGVVTRILQACIPFVYFPLILPAINLFSANPAKRQPLQNYCVMVFLGLILIAALGRNSRGAFGSALVTMAVSFLVAFLYGKTSLRWLRGPGLIFVILLGMIIGPLLNDLSMAMQMTRDRRASVSAVEMIALSLDAMTRREEIDTYRKLVNFSAAEGGWSEHYSSNSILNRFIQVKFHDNGVWLKNRFDPQDTEILKTYTLDKLWAILPDPVLRTLGISVNKQSIYSTSLGDLMMIRGTEAAHATLRTGSFIAHGAAILGIYYPLVIGMVSLILFILVDSLIIQVESAAQLSGKVSRKGNEQLHYSALALVNVYSFSLMFSAESLTDFAGFILRNFMQLVFFYAVAIFATSIQSSRSSR